MAPIDSLPLETLTQILETAYVLPSEREWWNSHEHKAVLKGSAAAALVARRWKAPAQALLWQQVSLVLPGAANRMMASRACGSHRTARVALSPQSVEDDGETIGGVLGRLKGIKSLHFTAPVRNGRSPEVTWLKHPSLQDLKTLYVDAPFIADVPANLVPSLRLQTLTLGPYAVSCALNRTLFASSSSSLLSLTLEMPKGLHSSLLSTLPLVANHITSLTLHGGITNLGPLFSSSASLARLSLHFYSHLDPFEHNTFLLALASPLESLELVLGALALSRDALQVLAAKMQGPKWKPSGMLRVRVSKAKVDHPAGKKFLEQCEERGVEVVFD